MEKGASVNAETDVSMNGKGRIELSIISVQSKVLHLGYTSWSVHFSS